ncbi:MAG: MotA/TolQ/ExbB proton channel family protein [Rhodocyclaceae bacterium]|nr:MotA/TolQ/ExbB proton channel family protein [Rhodocyclaceae bacterium]
MNEQLGLFHMLQSGGFIIGMTAIALLVMSIISWTVIIVKGLGVQRAKKQAAALQNFWHSTDLAHGIRALDNVPGHTNPFKQLAVEGQSAMQHHRHSDKQLHDTLDLSDWMTGSLSNAIDDARDRLSHGLALLASIGSTAPFVGLFGTVWGIYHALLTISDAGSAGLDKVAGPVGEALIMTAFGLVVAIPAVLGYNALVRGNAFIVGKLNRFAYDLHAYFVTGTRIERPQVVRRMGQQG